jgi:hypothetical protein
MKDVIVRFADEHQGKSREELSAILDREIEAFSQFMSTIGDWKSVGPLSPPERALIKTYLVHKVTGKIDGGR